MNHKGQMEILLLLCCVAGVVAFLSFAIGAINLAAKVDEKQPEVTVLIKENDRLMAEKKRIEEEVARLERMIDDLRKKLEQKRKEPIVKKLPDKGLERKKLEEELNRLKEEYEKLLKMIREKEEELARVRTEALTLAEKVKKEAELKKLLGKLEEEFSKLERRIKEKEAELAKIAPAIDDSFEKEIAKLKKAIEEAEKRKKELEKELVSKERKQNVFNPTKDMPPGSLSLKNPLYVECKENFIELHPEKRVLGIPELNKGNPFLHLSDKYDGIVFLIRPSGFKSYRASFTLAEKTNLPLCYEPVDAHWVLEF